MPRHQFLMVAAMHFPSGSSSLEKLRYWWWVMLFTDENSQMSGDKSPLIPREDVVKLAVGETLRSGMNAADICVPLETVGRFLRDLLSSCSGLKIAAGMEVSASHELPWGRESAGRRAGAGGLEKRGRRGSHQTPKGPETSDCDATEATHKTCVG